MTKIKLISAKNLLAKQMMNKAFAHEYNSLEKEYEFAKELIRNQIKAKSLKKTIRIN